MWMTFRQMRVSSSHRRTAAVGPGGGPLLQLGWRQRRFKWYALYSWGCSLLVCAVTGESNQGGRGEVDLLAPQD